MVEYGEICILWFLHMWEYMSSFSLNRTMHTSGMEMRYVLKDLRRILTKSSSLLRTCIPLVSCVSQSTLTEVNHFHTHSCRSIKTKTDFLETHDIYFSLCPLTLFITIYCQLLGNELTPILSSAIILRVFSAYINY
jgi:hypothetical protein